MALHGAFSSSAGVPQGLRTCVVPLEVCLEDLLVRFVKFCKDKCEFPFPLTESGVYSFLDALRERCAATFPQSFLRTLTFLKFVLGLTIQADVLGPRVKGLAKRKYLEKRALMQRPALRAAMVLALEHIVLGRGNFTAADRVAAGFFLFLIFGRARHSDGQAAGELEFEHKGEGSAFEGYVEACIERSKTSYTLERKTRFLPIVALMQGLADRPWPCLATASQGCGSEAGAWDASVTGIRGRGRMARGPRNAGVLGQVVA